MHGYICDVSWSINRCWTYQSLEQSSSHIGSIHKQCSGTSRSLGFASAWNSIFLSGSAMGWAKQVVHIVGWEWYAFTCVIANFWISFKNWFVIFFLGLLRIYKINWIICKNVDFTRYYEIRIVKLCHITSCKQIY